MIDHVHALAAFIKSRRHIDRGQLLEELVEAFPTSSGAEIQEAINARSRPVLVLPGRTIQPKSDKEPTP